MGRARAAFNAALHPRGPDGRFVGKGSLGSKVIGASERGDRSVPSPKGTAAARFAALKDAQYARVSAATKEARAVDLARAVHLKPDGKGGFTNVGSISRSDAAKVMFGDAGAPAAPPRKGITKPAHQVRNYDHVGKTVRFTVKDKWDRPGREKHYEGKLLEASVIMPPSPSPTRTALRIEGVQGSIWVDDDTEIEVLDNPPKGRARSAAAKMAKANPSTPVVRSAGVFSTDREIRAAAERGIDESNRQVAASKARLAKADVPSGGRFANADADMRAMTSREAGEAYLAGATKAQLVEVAKAVGVADTRTDKTTLRKRIIEHAIGYRLNSDAIRNGWNDRSRVSPPAAPSGVDATVEARIRSAYEKLLANERPWYEGGGEGVTLRELREELKDVPRADLDAALTRLGRGDGPADVSIYPQSYGRHLGTGARSAAALHLGGQERDIISIQGASAAAPPASPPAKRTARSMLKSPFDASNVAVEVSNLQTKAEILQRLDGLTVAELRKVATQFNIGIPAGVKGRDAIRAYIADAHFGGRGRWTWR